MRRAKATLAVGLALCLTGCVLRGKQRAAAPQPPPPIPAAPPQPLSTPQTQVQLPPPQPIDPAALAVAEVPIEPSPPAPAVAAPAPAKPAAAAPPPKPEPAPAAQAAPPERPPILEIVPLEEQKRLQESAEARKKEIQQRLQQAQARRLNSQEHGLVDRIQSFVKLSDAAAARGDLRQADALAERAQILARDLRNGK